MIRVLLAALFTASAVYGAKPDWDGLRTTWSLNPFNPYAFQSLPRDLSGDIGDFKLRDNQCDTPNANFVGQRYWYKEDPAVTLLYDKNGIIAGIQTSLLKSVYTPSDYLKNQNFVDDGDYWTITAYFVDPSTICTGGRTSDQLKQNGTGTGLWLQWGTNPLKDSILMPTSEEEVKKTLWKYGHCFWTMGNHYWYNVTKDMDCGHYIPNCLMYNKGKLTAFCFSMNALLDSPRYEHPTNKQAKQFIDPVPDCFFSDPSFKKSSTIHVYLIDNPRTSSFC
jgi:hypothetical protein